MHSSSGVNKNYVIVQPCCFNNSILSNTRGIFSITLLVHPAIETVTVCLQLLNRAASERVTAAHKALKVLLSEHVQ